MTSLFEKLGTLVSRRKDRDGSPFESAAAVQKWLEALPAEFDYETHHALVEGLERFNAGNVEASPERLEMLLAIEEAGFKVTA
mgnify:FL=1